MTSKLEHALRLAEDGYYVFPCKENGKTPLVPWTERSTRNKDTIKAWWTPDFGAEHNYNIGIDCGKSGILVVDVDCKNNQPGKENYEQLDKEKGFGKDIFTVITPSGGLHLYYRNSDFGNTASKLAVGIDTRGSGGYVLAAGSEIDGKAYIATVGLRARDTLQSVEPWLGEALSASRTPARSERKSSEKYTEDDPGDIAYAIELLQSLEGAAEDGTGDITTYKTFCKLKDRGVSLATAIELAAEHWNPNCCPPWEPEELKVKAENAYRYGQNGTGALSPMAEFDIPKETPKVPAEPQAPRFNAAFELPDASTIKPRDWVFGGMALAKQVSMLVAMPGVGKSTFTLSMALSKVTGRNILGIDPFARGAVALFNNEDNMDEQTRRLVAAAQKFKINKTDLYRTEQNRDSMLFLNGRDHPLRIAKRIANNTIKAVDADPMADYALENDIRLMIVDPFSMTHPATENSNEEIIKVGTLFNYVAEKSNAAVLIVHHTRKNQMASAQGHSGNLDSARGASALGGLVRVAYTLDSLSSQEAKRVGITEEQRRNYVLLEQAKANMSAPGVDRHYYLRHGEVVGTPEYNESVGVLVPVKLNAMNAASDAIRTLIQHLEDILKDGEQSVPDIVKMLPEHHHAYYAEKQPGAISQAIHRLFKEEKVITGFTGSIHADDRNTGKTRNTRYLSLKIPNSAFAHDATDLEDII